MPGFTTPDGFIHEVEGDQPLISLTGGSSGTFPILAEQVQTKITNLEVNTVGGIDSRVAALEAVPTPPSWVAIQSGTVANVATFVIPNITTGAYSRVRLTMHGEADSASDPIRIRVNGDDTAGLHRSGLIVRDSDDNPIGTVGGFEDGTFWNIAQWGTGNGCTVTVEIIRTDVSEACAFQAHGTRIGGSASAHTFSRSGGRLNSFRLLDSLRVSGPTGANFSAVWWLEGAPV